MHAYLLSGLPICGSYQDHSTRGAGCPRGWIAWFSSEHSWSGLETSASSLPLLAGGA
jgi:hypothetical protein